MSGLYLLLPTFLVILLSLLVVWAGGIALTMTGMDEKKARFQALSAFTRTGFTTREAELVTNNPRRRTIITWLMILGNAGIITVIVTATSSLASSTGEGIGIGVAALIVSILLIYLIARYTPLSRIWGRFIEKRFIDSDFFEEGVSEDLLHLSEGYGVVKIFVAEDSPLIGRTLYQANTEENDFWVVGIERGKEWVSLPRSVETIQEKDRLIIYGDIDQLKSIFGKHKDSKKGQQN
jgi:hypothetical protein